MTDVSRRKRQPKGAPASAGGEFASNSHDEAGAPLSAQQEDELARLKSLRASNLNDFAIFSGVDGHHVLIEKVDVDGRDAYVVSVGGVVHTTETEGSLNAAKRIAADYMNGISSDGISVNYGYKNSLVPKHVVPELSDDRTLARRSGEERWHPANREEVSRARLALALHSAAQDNPKGASVEEVWLAHQATMLSSRQAFDSIGKLLQEAGVKKTDASDTVYAGYMRGLSASTLMPEERTTYIKGKLQESGKSWDDLEDELGNEFGLLIEHRDGTMFQEHPTRILSRIPQDYLDEVLRDVARRES